MGKFRIKEVIQEYGKEKSYLEKRDKNNLLKRHEELVSRDSGDTDHDEINNIDIKLKQYEINDLEKARIRARNNLFRKPKEKKQPLFSFNLKITIFKITEYVKF